MPDPAQAPSDSHLSHNSDKPGQHSVTVEASESESVRDGSSDMTRQKYYHVERNDHDNNREGQQSGQQQSEEKPQRDGNANPASGNSDSGAARGIKSVDCVLARGTSVLILALVTALVGRR